MNDRLKKFIIFLGVILILAISLASAIAYFNEEKIRILAVEQLNKLLSTEVSVEKIEFSLLERFPSASIHFKNIKIQESSKRKDKINLLEAQSLFLEFDPFNLLTGNYSIDEIYLSKSILNIEFFKDGSNNFQFLKSDEEDSNFQISLEKVVFNETVINYNDNESHVILKTKANKLVLSGDFESTEYDLNLSSTGVLNQFVFKDISAKRPYPFQLDLIINIKTDKDFYAIKKAKVLLNNIPFTLSGNYQKSGISSTMDLSFNSDNFTFKEVSSFLPEKTQNLFFKFNTKGILNLNGSFKGKLNQKENPAIHINFALNNGELFRQEYKYRAKNIAFTGTFSNGKHKNNHTSVLNIENLTFDNNYGSSQGSFSLTNMENPYLKFEISSTLDLSSLIDLVQNDSLEILEGKCQYSIKAETYLDSLNSIGVNDIKSAKALGSLKIFAGKIKWKGYKHAVENIEARARFGNNLVYIDTLNYSLANVFSEVSGKLHNFLPYLFFEKEKLTANAHLYYPNLDLNKILQVDDDDDEKAGFFLPVSDMINLNVSLKADKFEIEKFKAENVSCEIISNHPYLIAQKLSMDAMEGKYTGWMQFDLNDLNNILCSSKLNLSHVNINEMFFQFENFGQSSLQAENLYGYTNADIDFRSALDRDLNIKQESVEVICKLEIKNGRLLNYEPIMALSKYIDVEELQDIQFSRLTNNIEIKNRVIFIPEMAIKTTAFELVLSGKHSFDNEIDYHFRLWLNDFLFKKAKRSKKNQEDFGDVQVDDEGRAKLYLRMVGTLDDYKIKYDRKALREKWKDDFNEERQELKELFREEFSSDKKVNNTAPINIGIEWGEIKEDTSGNDPSVSQKKNQEEKQKKEKKSFLDKIGKGVDDEYEEYDPDKLD